MNTQGPNRIAPQPTTNNSLKSSLATGHLSIQPLEPVLVFDDEGSAKSFRTLCSVARIFETRNPTWVYVPMPAGLLRVRTARRGDVAFDFESTATAAAWNASIRSVGSIHAPYQGRPDFDRTVYVGKALRT